MSQPSARALGLELKAFLLQSRGQGAFITRPGSPKAGIRKGMEDVEITPKCLRWSSSTVKIREWVPGQHKTFKMEKGRGKGKELRNWATLPQKSLGRGEVPAARCGSSPKEPKGIQHSPHTLAAGKPEWLSAA